MQLKPFQKNLKKPLKTIGVLMAALLAASCATTYSSEDVEEVCNAQAKAFVPYANCIVTTYNNLPEDKRASYSDLDRYFVDQANLLAERVQNGEMNETEARAALSRVRVEIESQRRERNYQYDRGRFGVGFGVGHGGYYGGYGF